MTPSQIAAWLEAMPEAARLFNFDHILIGQNIRAKSAEPERQYIATHDLGDGWQLETWTPLNLAEPDVRSLANGLAHTLRNPLSSILTAADLVRDDPQVGAESQMLLGIITKESHQLNRILTDFLNYVRPRPSQPASFDLARALRDVINSLRLEKTLPKNIRVRDELPPFLPVLGDEDAIRQSLCHVVKNAVEAMKGKGALRLSGETLAAGSRVHIEDEGPGFSNESLQRAFEPFYSYTPECAGLGLSVALAAVSREGGCITIENIERKSDDIEYSNSMKIHTPSSAKLVKGARVCIELNAPNGESKIPPSSNGALQRDEVTTI